MESMLVKNEVLKRQLVFGNPKPRMLSKWFYKLNLEYCNIIIKEPLDCLNFVTDIMKYYDDQVTHNLAEHWLQNPKEVYEWIFYMRKGDCDDAALTLASILYTLGNPNVRLAIGYYGNPKYANTEKIEMNHAYCLLEDKDNNKFLLLDPVGDQQQKELYDIDSYPEYITMISAAANGEVFLHGPWIKKFS